MTERGSRPLEALKRPVGIRSYPTRCPLTVGLSRQCLGSAPCVRDRSGGSDTCGPNTPRTVVCSILQNRRLPCEIAAPSPRTGNETVVGLSNRGLRNPYHLSNSDQHQLAFNQEEFLGGRIGLSPFVCCWSSYLPAIQVGSRSVQANGELHLRAICAQALQKSLPVPKLIQTSPSRACIPGNAAQY